MILLQEIIISSKLHNMEQQSSCEVFQFIFFSNSFFLHRVLPSEPFEALQASRLIIMTLGRPQIEFWKKHFRTGN
jgi:hypothetical protein